MLANYTWARGLPWDTVDIFRGTPLETTGSWNFNFIYVCVCKYAHISMGTPGDQKKVSDFLELGLQAAVCPLTWMLGMELGSSREPAGAAELLRGLGVCFLTLHFYFYERSCFVILAHVIIVS